MMSDDLVKRLRGFPPNIYETMTEAADRIAALEAAVTQCRTLSAMLKPQADRIAELEAALQRIALAGGLFSEPASGQHAREIARAALEGGKK